MKRIATPWIVLLILGFLGLAWYLLPQLEIHNKLLTKPAIAEPPQEMIHRVPTEASSITLFSDDARYVEAGDTLGYYLVDRFSEQRARLLDTANLSLEDATGIKLAPAFSTLRNEILQRTPQVKREVRAPSGNPALSTTQRELLESELMGLEDASAYLLGDITQAQDAGDAELAATLKSQLSQKQTAIRSLRERLVAPRSPNPIRVELAPSGLSKAAKVALADLGHALPRDTVFIPAERRGFFRPQQQGDTLGRYEVNTANQALDTSSVAQGSYALVSTGIPTLWAKASRVDLDSLGAVGNAAIRVIVPQNQRVGY